MLIGQSGCIHAPSAVKLGEIPNQLILAPQYYLTKLTVRPRTGRHLAIIWSLAFSSLLSSASLHIVLLMIIVFCTAVNDQYGHKQAVHILLTVMLSCKFSREQKALSPILKPFVFSELQFEFTLLTSLKLRKARKPWLECNENAPLHIMLF